MVATKHWDHFPRFDAVMFDMDGTLVDSEVRTDPVVRSLLQEHGLDPGTAGDLSDFHGATWQYIAKRLQEYAPILSNRPLADELLHRFDASLKQNPPPPIPGAEDALAAAIQGYPSAIVTSSNRGTLEHIITHLGVQASALVTVCAEDVQHSKPNPEAFLLAARKLGVPPATCLVFEDSDNGLDAARAAGMLTIAIAHGSSVSRRQALAQSATQVISDYSQLPADFFRELRPGSD